MLRVFQENLSALRKRASLTQLELANRMGCQPNTVSRWECGEAMPGNMQMFVHLSQALEIDTWQLFHPNPVQAADDLRYAAMKRGEIPYDSELDLKHPEVKPMSPAEQAAWKAARLQRAREQSAQRAASQEAEAV